MASWTPMDATRRVPGLWTPHGLQNSHSETRTSQARRPRSGPPMTRALAACTENSIRLIRELRVLGHLSQRIGFAGQLLSTVTF
jgi:hypothetical protein